MLRFKMPYGVVYGLYDPCNDELRYIGQTTQSLKRRLYGHMFSSNLKGTRHCQRWLAKLRSLNFIPVIRQLGEATSKENLDALEIRLIAEAQTLGISLTNHSSGGGGAKGYKHTEEFKRRLSERMKIKPIWTPKHMAHLASMKIGVPRSIETKVKISASRKGQFSAWKGRHHSEESKTKIRSNGKFWRDAEHYKYRHDIPTELIIQKIQEGFSKAQLAKDWGVSESFIYCRIKKLAPEIQSNLIQKGRNRIPTFPKGRPTKEDLQTLYIIQNKTDYEIGDLYGVTNGTISKWRKELGIITKSQLARLSAKCGRRDKFGLLTSEQLTELYALMSQKAIAEKYKVSRPTVVARLARFGIKFNRELRAKINGKICF